MISAEERRWEERDRRWTAWVDSREERWADWAEASEKRWEERGAENRRFHQGLLTRHAEITERMIGALSDMTAEIADGRQQIQANTRAVLRLLDERFGPEPPQG